MNSALVELQAGLGFGVQGLGFRGLGFRVQGSEQVRHSIPLKSLCNYAVKNRILNTKAPVVTVDTKIAGTSQSQETNLDKHGQPA